MLTVLVAPQLHADICPALRTTPPLCLYVELVPYFDIYLHTHYLHTLSLAAYMLSLSPSNKKDNLKNAILKKSDSEPQLFHTTQQQT